ncbi:MAG: hypothetical protein WA005_01960 [Candidatus Binataceae bacterium]
MKKAATVAAVVLLLIATSAEAWDSGTHRLITRLAIGALPPSPLAALMARNSRRLQKYAVIPDTRLKELYGDAERRRHFIDLEYFGNDPLSAISPDLHATERNFGVAVLIRAGILPWTIDQVSTELAAAWDAGNCVKMLILSGYLSHYVGDLSQPLHTTVNFDGLVPADRGVHARFERAVDHSTGDLADLSRPQVHIIRIDSVWKVVIDGLRESHQHVAEVVEDDRAARASSDGGGTRLRARDDGARAGARRGANRALGLDPRLDLALRVEPGRPSAILLVRRQLT